MPYHVRVEDSLLQAMNARLRTKTEVILVLFVLRKTKGFGKEHDWIAHKQFLETLGLGRASFYRCMRGLISRSIILCERVGRRCDYAVNPNLNAWGVSLEKRAKVLPIVQASIGLTYETKRSHLRDSKGLMDETLFIYTGIHSYRSTHYSPAGTDFKIPLTKLKSWPSPLLSDPETLSRYIKEHTKAWPLDFLQFLGDFLQGGRKQLLHPDDIKATIDGVNRLKEQLTTRDEYWGLCRNSLGPKYEKRRQAIELEIHELRKRELL